MQLPKAAELFERKIDDPLTYYRFLVNHWTRIVSNNPLVRLVLEILHRTQVVSALS
ncbi:transposase [Granulosicoccus sp. 3-233]|uniref:transposase n=1 Tax=Granulosicoccus sp. 3-233 TaxID=3417969 RepID=UPI003D3455D7